MGARVEIQDYDSDWPALFDRIRRRVIEAVGLRGVSVEHIGCTAVPGLAAKPIIDVDVVVDSSNRVAATMHRLEVIGYRHEGDLGVSGREAFKPPAGLPYHHLYVVLRGCQQHQRHVAFRDHLRRHSDDAARYGEVKKALAVRFGSDRDDYTEAKWEVIDDILRRAEGSRSKVHHGDRDEGRSQARQTSEGTVNQ